MNAADIPPPGGRSPISLAGLAQAYRAVNRLGTCEPIDGFSGAEGYGQAPDLEESKWAWGRIVARKKFNWAAQGGSLEDNFNYYEWKLVTLNQNGSADSSWDQAHLFGGETVPTPTDPEHPPGQCENPLIVLGETYEEWTLEVNDLVYARYVESGGVWVVVASSADGRPTVGEGGTITVKEDDGTPTISNVGEARFKHCVVEQVTPGVARVTPQNATTLLPGITSQSDQEMGNGFKSFKGVLVRAPGDGLTAHGIVGLNTNTGNASGAANQIHDLIRPDNNGQTLFIVPLARETEEDLYGSKIDDDKQSLALVGSIYFCPTESETSRVVAGDCFISQGAYFVANGSSRANWGGGGSGDPDGWRCQFYRGNIVGPYTKYEVIQTGATTEGEIETLKSSASQTLREGVFYASTKIVAAEGYGTFVLNDYYAGVTGTLSDGSEVKGGIVTFIGGGGGSGGGGTPTPAPAGASYLVLSNDADLTNERALGVTSGHLTLTDGGANGSATLGLPSVVSSGTTTHPSSITVDAQGRVTSISGIVDDIEEVLGSSVTPDIGWSNVMTMTLPSAGRWRIRANLRWAQQASAAGEFVKVRLLIDGSAITNSERLVCSSDTTVTAGTTSLDWRRVNVTAGQVITLQGVRSNGATWTICDFRSDSNGYSVLSAERG